VQKAIHTTHKFTDGEGTISGLTVFFSTSHTGLHRSDRHRQVCPVPGISNSNRMRDERIILKHIAGLVSFSAT
jgi:hypothetical protein